MPDAATDCQGVEAACDQRRDMAVPQPVKGDRGQLARLHEARKIAAQIVGRHRRAVERSEYQCIGVEPAEAKLKPLLELTQAVLEQRFDRERRQADASDAASRRWRLEG
jgi:hypothetical protein